MPIVVFSWFDNPYLKGKKIGFSLNAPQANEVLLMGDFNQWNGKNHNMKKGDLPNGENFKN